MSNLPPGVTGGEYQIAGAQAEVDQVMECEAEDVQITTLSPFGQDRIKKALDLMREDPGKPARDIYSYLLTAQDEVNKVDMEICPFVGNVTVYRHGASQWWRCPLCNHDHQDEYDPQPDEDYGRDR